MERTATESFGIGNYPAGVTHADFREREPRPAEVSFTEFAAADQDKAHDLIEQFMDERSSDVIFFLNDWLMAKEDTGERGADSDARAHSLLLRELRPWLARRGVRLHG